MRAETRECFSDLAYSEAMHDQVVDEVVALQVEVGVFGAQPLGPGAPLTTTRWEPVVISPALSYLLFDELRIGIDKPKDGQTIELRIVLPPKEKRMPDRPPEDYMDERPDWADKEEA